MDDSHALIWVLGLVLHGLAIKIQHRHFSLCIALSRPQVKSEHPIPSNVQDHEFSEGMKLSHTHRCIVLCVIYQFKKFQSFSSTSKSRKTFKVRALNLLGNLEMVDIVANPKNIVKTSK
ncbi:hypothetical protein CCACVL1_04434 [Corchorus capsularis]|uniref:Uncharacterized protein n=1 Tax=Corchorus capsularis TaxID=210143 RepID=A0A1R3JSF7_COCAP|nr:hypothetical protein CCACVL1_04434 [Corchorus capsularis]